MGIQKNAKWIREQLGRGEIVYGSHVFSGTPMLAEAIALAGFDMLWIDMEHTGIDKSSVLNNLIATRSGGAASLVRIPWNDPVLAKPILDMGADAILFPYICGAEDARRAVAACEYPPKGIRGFGPLRALDYGKLNSVEYVDNIYRDMLRMIQIEHIDAVNDLDNILDVEGIDAFIVGPNDLAASVGHLGRPNHRDMLPIYDKIGEKLARAGRPFGVSMSFSADILKQWLDRGAKLLFSGYDTGYVFEGATAVYNGLRELEKS